MSTRDNAPPPPDWHPEPRCCPFPNCGVCETPQQAYWLHGTDAHLIRGEN